MVNRVSRPCNVIDASEGVFINRLVEVWCIGARTDVAIVSLKDMVTNTVAITLEFVVTSL